MKKTPKKGEQEIRDSRLTAVPNQYAHREYEVEITLPEFTCKCPLTGYPDFAVLTLKYVPGPSIVELKSLKLYINRFRDEYHFHEAVVNRILDDLVDCLDPRRMELTGDFHPRGNVHTVVRVRYEKDDS